MTDHHESNAPTKERERELELEVTRLQAEVDALKGEDPATATTRFLAMAAETVDKAVADARREADEIVEEICAEAEARRDEATRVAAEAEAMVEQLLAEADRAKETVDEANEQAAAIKTAAEEEAAEFVAAEREKVAAELEAVAEVREGLEEERAEFETYHASLRDRVQELAESMVSFMHTELAAVGDTFDGLVPPQLVAVAADDDDDAETASSAPADEPSVVASADPWVEMLESAIPDQERVVDMPASAIDEIPPGPPDTFGDVPVKEDPEDTSVSGGLFSRRRTDKKEVGFDDLADGADEEEDEEDKENGGLFGMLGPRLIEQTSPEELAEALETDDSEDQAFREFIDGDDAPDPSRDWLLRPEQS